MAWMRRRWVQVAWLDTALKRLLHLLIALGVSFGFLWTIAILSADETNPSRRFVKSLIYAVLVFVIWILVALVKFIALPIRAARSGKFLDEYAVEKVRKTRALQQGLSEPSASTTLYKGIDPAQKGRSLKKRVNDVYGFRLLNQRMPTREAPVGSDEYFYAQTLTELARALDSGVATPEQEKLGKDIDSLSEGWRQAYGASGGVGGTPTTT